MPRSSRTPQAGQFDSKSADELVLATLRAFVAETHPTRAVAVNLDSDFERDLALDSVSRMEFALRLQQAVGEAPPDAAITDATTLRQLLNLWSSRGPASSLPQKPLPAMPGPSEAPLPEAAATLIEVLDWHAHREPGRRHVLLPGEAGELIEITYEELMFRARRRAAGLIAHGVNPGQTVALMLPTGREYLECFFAIMIAGAYPVPIYPPARINQLAEHLQRHARILQNAQAACLITVREAKSLAGLLPGVLTVLSPADLAGSAAAPLPKAGGNDIAFLQYTSGSTGDPKGVVLTHANVLANIRAMGRAAKVRSDDVFVSWLPLYHDMGLIGAWLGSLYHGCPLVLLSPLAFLARPARWLHALTDFGGTLTAAPNFAFDLCARKLPEAELVGVDLRRVRIMFNGAEPVSPDTLDAFAHRFAPLGLAPQTLTPVYGLAENAVGLAFPPIGREPRIDAVDRERFTRERIAVPLSGANALRLPSCGRALPNHEIRVVDDLGRELPERTIGRVQFRGPSATSGYFRNPVATAALFKDGWLDTGDYGYLADAELFLTGRAKDLIIRGGHNLYPYELEDAVGLVPGVRRGCVAVFAASDLARGTEKLVVVAETREQDAAARTAIIERIQDLTVDLMGLPADEVLLMPPRTVLKTSSGKIRRAATRERFEQGRLGEIQSAWAPLIGMAWRGALERGRLHLREGVSALFGVWVWFVFAAITALVWPLVAAPRAPAWGRWVVHLGARALLRLTGFAQPRLRPEQLPARPHVLMANHASYADVLLLAAVLPPQLNYTFVAKRELELGWWSRVFLRGLGTLFVERGAALQSVQDAAVMTDALMRGQSLIIFPEATFTREAGLKPFHMGGFVAAARAGVPVATLGLRGTRRVLRDQTWLPRFGKITWQLGAVLVPPAPDWPAAVRLRDAARKQLLMLCAEPDLQAQ